MQGAKSLGAPADSDMRIGWSFPVEAWGGSVLSVAASLDGLGKQENEANTAGQKNHSGKNCGNPLDPGLQRFAVTGVGILIFAVNQVLLKAGREDIAVLASVAGLVVVLFLVVDLIAQLLNNVKSIFGLY